MTLFRRRVLEAIQAHPYEGTLAIGMELYGDASDRDFGLGMRNITRAVAWLERRGYVNWSGLNLTDKGEAALAPVPPVK